ncbi:hypothetical protein [Moorella sulfitireducens (nom. illeg.)]|uniref:hypothetical protein n=1 Tax=Neomoorella sulfitireducens TaxID=2972948 RepID=UPI0021AD4C5C|nr:hypothetical protein [Moorella sulfitireducens]
MAGKTYRVVLLFLLVLLTTGCGLNNTGIKQARSLAEVDQYLAAMTPGLTRAQELGLVTPLNIEIPVLEANTAVHLEKIWYNSQEVFLFYSLANYRQDPNQKHGLPYMYLDFGSLETAGGEKLLNSPGYTSNFSPQEGIVYRGRYYGRMTYNPLQKVNGEKLPAVDKVVWKQAKLIIGDKSYPLQPVTLTVNYDQSREIEQSYVINYSQELLGRKFEAKELLLGVAENRLRFTFSTPKNERVYKVAVGKIVTDKKEEYYINPVVETSNNPNEFWLVFPAFNQIPERITLKIEKLILLGDDELTFSFDLNPYKQYLAADNIKIIDLNQEVGNVHNTKVFIESVGVRDRGLSMNMLLIPDDNEALYEALEADRLMDGHKVSNPEYPNLIYITNERGEVGTIGGVSVGPGNREGVTINPAFIEQSQRLNVKIAKLPYALNGSWLLEIELNSPGGKQR